MKMWKQFGSSVAVLTLAFMLSACDKKDEAPPVGQQPPPTGNQNPPTGGSGTCTVPTPKKDTIVYWSGLKGPGTAFPDASADYVGKIVTMYSNNGQYYVEVDWDLLAENKAHTFSSDTKVMPMATCSPDITGEGVVYVGAQDGSDPRFPSSGTLYKGTILRVYAGGFAEIDWNHLTEHTVEPFSSIALEAK